ncbi:MAG: hypothetical protein M3N68_03465 [Actinomycetota bacterium]|nr:hypothetical protein [Actinomycetota bacterium]
MLVLDFDGWAQCRLATDPDPADEPRGVSGWTFALAGEPDLDRVLRFQPAGTVPRRFGPPVGVAVRQVALDGRAVDGHVLAGASVDLVGDPVFDGRNGLAAEDGKEPIMPLHLRVEGRGVTLARRHADPVTGRWRATRPTFEPVPPELARRLGLGGRDGPEHYRQERARQVQEALESATDATAQVALAKRLDDLNSHDRPQPLPALLWGVKYRLRLEGADPEVADGAGRLVGVVAEGPWPLELWIGAWDADALCAFVQGRLALPFIPSPTS